MCSSAAPTGAGRSGTTTDGDWVVDDELELLSVGWGNPTLGPDAQWMAVADKRMDVDDVFDAGAVELYRRAADDGWALDTELVAPIPGEQDHFGSAGDEPARPSRSSRSSAKTACAAASTGSRSS